MREMVEIVGAADLVKGNVLACIFYEPSTRTSSSFIAAMERLGVLSFRLPVVCNSVRSAKEKTLQDTMRTLEQYADVIVLRHPSNRRSNRRRRSSHRAGHQRR